MCPVGVVVTVVVHTVLVELHTTVRASVFSMFTSLDEFGWGSIDELYSVVGIVIKPESYRLPVLLH